VYHTNTMVHLWLHQVPLSHSFYYKYHYHQAKIHPLVPCCQEVRISYSWTVKIKTIISFIVIEYLFLSILCHGPFGSTLIFCSGGLVFKAQSKNWLFRLRFLMVFLSSTRQSLLWYLKLCHDNFLSHPFHFVVY
jgi:hypothetical protein